MKKHPQVRAGWVEERLASSGLVEKFHHSSTNKNKSMTVGSQSTERGFFFWVEGWPARVQGHPLELDKFSRRAFVRIVALRLSQFKKTN